MRFVATGAAPAPARRARASGRGRWTRAAPAEPFVTAEDVRRGELARAWVSELYDGVDYAAVFAAAEEAAVLEDAVADALGGDEGERTYGEFDMGFFVALLRSLEDELALLEYGDVDGGAVSDGVFVDVGSGRGQLACVASVARKWQRCVGLEIDETLHAVAEQVATRSPNEDIVLLDEFIEAFPVASRPMTQSPLSFVCGSMYDRNDLRGRSRARRSSSPSPRNSIVSVETSRRRRERRRERRRRRRTMMSRPISTITTTTARI